MRSDLPPELPGSGGDSGAPAGPAEAPGAAEPAGTAVPARPAEPTGPAEPPQPSDWQRLHPLTPIVGVLETAAGFAIPILFVVFFSRGSMLEMFLLLSLIPSLVFSVVRYLFFSYRMGEEEIVVRQGVFRRTVRHVPYERIQNLDLTRNVLQRLFRLNQLSLETASGTEPEAVFRWVSQPEVQAIRARVTAARATRPAAVLERAEAEGVTRGPDSGTLNTSTPESGTASPPTLLHKVPLRDLVLLGAFSLRGFALFAAIFGLGWQFDLWERPGVVRWLRSLPERWADIAGIGIAIPITVGLGLLLIVSLVSIILTLVENYGFRLSDAGTELRTRVGLLTQHSSTIPKGRIQILQLVTPLHLRPFERVRVWAGTAGGRAQETAGRSWLLPIAPREKLGGVLAAVQPAAILAEDEWHPVHPRAGRRMQRRATLWIVVLTGLLCWQFGLLGLSLLLVVPIALVYADRTAHHLGYAVTEDALFARHGWLYRRTQIVRLSKIQSIRIVKSPFDRRWKMASLHVDTASPSRGQLHVPYLPEEIATRLQKQLASEAARRQFRW